jgi:NAD dependent epimerase/dehydratase family enzyme
LNISSKKILDSGFKFSFSTIERALKDIYHK